MKKILFVLFVGMFVFACGKDNESETEPVKDTTPPGAVSNVIATPGYAEVTLKWKKPSDADYGYTSIEYTKDGKLQVLQAIDSITIDGFADTTEYEFSLYAVDKNQNKVTEPVKVKVTPKENPSAVVVRTLGAVSVSGGIKVSWTNVTGKVITVSVNTIDRYGKAITQKKMSTKGVDNMTVVDIPINMTVAAGVTVSSGIEKHLKDFSLETFYTFNVRTWGIQSVSSEEITGEGAANGRAIFSIDGNAATYWHTLYTNAPVRTLPNWIIYDMGRMTELTWLKLTQRSGKTSLLKVEILVKNKIEDEWTAIGTLNFSIPPAAVELSKAISFATPTKGRYLKLNFPTSQSAIQTMLAEVEALGNIVEVGIQ